MIKIIYFKVIALALIISGELLFIYAEMIGAKNYRSINHSFWLFFKMFLISILAGGLLIMGYMVGFKFFKNIWIVSAISITTVLIVEPIVAYLIFRQLPTVGAGIGFVLGAVGLVVSLLI